MGKVLVTGGCGYIGSHTVVDLIHNGIDLISVDNFSNSTPDIIDKINTITNKKFINYDVNICDMKSLEDIFKENDISSIIHFASYKSVPESVYDPIKYYDNNIVGLLNLLKCSQKYNVKNFIFSSSCSIYGNSKIMPIKEGSSISPQSPYASTKAFSEKIIEDFSKACSTKFICLRYFNPIGCHKSLQIGEDIRSTNIMSKILSTYNKYQEKLIIFGNDWPTIDGYCIRDYIHVCDVAESHRISLQSIDLLHDNIYKINIGRGEGISVMEIIKIFEKVSNSKINYEISNRREGDVAEVWSDTKYCKEILNWRPMRTIELAVKSSFLFSIK